MGFSADWLALREPADHAARDRRLLEAAAAAAGPAPMVLDLGCGTGSTVRAFDGRLGPDVRWRPVDADATLLDRAAAAAPGRAETHRIDLRDLAALPLDGVTLVTASALLDLVSSDWLERLAALLAARRLPFYAALTYDGSMAWDPARTDDAAVTAAFNRHQQGDKGFGPALGPAAADAAGGILRRAGYVVDEAESPWQLGPGEAALQRALVAGIADAAGEAGAALATGWGAARQDAAATTICRVGHRDVLAQPSPRTRMYDEE